MMNHDHAGREAVAAMYRFVRPHVICEDLKVSCGYSAEKHCYRFLICSREMNFAVHTDVTEEAYHSEPIEAVVVIGRSFLNQFKQKHPGRYIEDAE